MASINQFRAGQFITRTKPTRRFGDRSYMGDPLLYLGICNNKIIVEHLNRFRRMIGNRSDLEIDEWCDGWELYQDPDKLISAELLLGLLARMPDAVSRIAAAKALQEVLQTPRES